MAPQRDEYLQPQTSEPLEPRALGQRAEQTRGQIFIPAPYAAQFIRRAAAKERREHEAKDFAQQGLLTSETAFDLLDEMVRQAYVVEGLFEGLDGTLRLGVIALEAFSGGAGAVSLWSVLYDTV